MPKPSCETPNFFRSFQVNEALVVLLRLPPKQLRGGVKILFETLGGGPLEVEFSDFDPLPVNIENELRGLFEKMLSQHQ